MLNQKKTFLLVLCFAGLAGGHAAAMNFVGRADAGKQAAESQDGKDYEESLNPIIYKTITACIPPGSTAPENLGKFTLVAYVDKLGMVSFPQAKPETKVSQCFLESFSKEQLPSPPPAPESSPEFPITIEMDITP